MCLVLNSLTFRISLTRRVCRVSSQLFARVFSSRPRPYSFSCARLCFSKLALGLQSQSKPKPPKIVLCVTPKCATVSFLLGLSRLAHCGRRASSASWASLHLLLCLCCLCVCLAFCCCSIACSSNRPPRRPLCPSLCHHHPNAHTHTPPRVQDASLYSAGLSNHRSNSQRQAHFDWSFICCKVAPILFAPSFIFPPSPLRALATQRHDHEATASLHSKPCGKGTISARLLLLFAGGPRPRCC